MGLLRRLFSTGRAPTTRPVEAASPPRARVDLRLPEAGRQTIASQPVAVSGTTTFGRDGLAALVLRREVRQEAGYLEVMGTLQREPDNEADPFAVAVLVEADLVGYLPGHLARAMPLPASVTQAAPVQVFSEQLETGLRCEAWVWLGEGPPRWQWSAAKRPPLSPEAKEQARHQVSRRIVSDNLAAESGRSDLTRAGMVNGVHFLELVEPIKQLKREGRLDEALVLCHAAIEGAERERENREPAPWYTEQAAIVHRKLGQHDEEVAVLRRWLRACPVERRAGSRIQQRLTKLVGDEDTKGRP